MCVGVRGESKNTKSGLCVPRARPNPCLQERQKKWRRPLLPQTAAQCAWVSKAISETLKAALKGRLKKQLSPTWAWLVQTSLLNTQDGPGPILKLSHTPQAPLRV